MYQGTNDDFIPTGDVALNIKLGNIKDYVNANNVLTNNIPNVRMEISSEGHHIGVYTFSKHKQEFYDLSQTNGNNAQVFDLNQWGTIKDPTTAQPDNEYIGSFYTDSSTAHLNLVQVLEQYLQIVIDSLNMETQV